jgi:hypothetical protein
MHVQYYKFDRKILSDGYLDVIYAFEFKIKKLKNNRPLSCLIVAGGFLFHLFIASCMKLIQLLFFFVFLFDMFNVLHLFNVVGSCN